MTDLITRVENRYMKKDIPPIEPGDSVRVRLRIPVGGSDEAATRIHTFAGTVIACKGGGINRSITVRRVTYGIGVERTFPLHSPTVVDVEIVRRGRHERAARLKERRRPVVRDTVVADTEEPATGPEAQAVASEPEVGEEPQTQADEEPESKTVDESGDEMVESSEASEDLSEDTDS